MLNRYRSAFILGPATLIIVCFGGWVFEGLVLAGVSLALREWFLIVLPTRAAPWLIMAGVGAVLLVFGVEAVLGTAPALAAAIFLAFPLAFVVPGVASADRLWLGIGLPYIAACGIALVWMRSLGDAGLGLVLYLLLTVWATDSAAFFVGRGVGGPRLCPGISPQKTWAGLVGGMAGAGLAGALVATAAQAQQPGLAAVFAVFLAGAEQAGDLFESALKRRYKIKDSGHLIPGHGGLLDRIDGLIAAGPVLALFHATVGASIGWW